MLFGEPCIKGTPVVPPSEAAGAVPLTPGRRMCPVPPGSPGEAASLHSPTLGVSARMTSRTSSTLTGSSRPPARRKTCLRRLLCLCRCGQGVCVCVRGGSCHEKAQPSSPSRWLVGPGF